MTIPSNPSPGEIWTNDVTGVSYRWDDDRWVVVSTSGDEPADIYATIVYSDEEDAKLQAQIDALTPEPDLGPPTTVQRLYRFTRNSSGLSNGDMFGSTTSAEGLTMLVFADKDSTNQDTPVFSAGDEVAFGGWSYKFTSSTGNLEYVSGPGGNIVENNRYAVTFTIYPTGLANRVAAGEETQAQIQQTISDALEVQERTLKKDEVNRVTSAFRVSSDTRTFVSTANNELGLYNVADPTNPAHALNLGYADDRYLQSTDVR